MHRLIIIIYLLALPIMFLNAEVWVADTTGTERDSLQAAIDAAWADPGIDTVLLMDGTYHVVGTDTNLGIVMHDSVVLMSQNGADACTLTGISETGTDTAWHVIYCAFDDSLSHAAEIVGFTITSGKARGDDLHSCGGGIHCICSSPTIRNNTVSYNRAEYGGGIYCSKCEPIVLNNFINRNSSGKGGGVYCDSSNPTIEDNVIVRNFAAKGAGIYCYCSSPIIQNDSIIDNPADKGGGIYCNLSDPTVEDNLIADNWADFSGGGIYCYKSDPTIRNNTITDNLAHTGWYSGNGAGICCDSSNPVIEDNIITGGYSVLGGGIYCCDCSPIIRRNLIHSNHCGGPEVCGTFGGGIYCSDGNPTIQNNTISNNSCKISGGGILCDSSNSIIENNTIVGNVCSAIFSVGSGAGIACWQSEPVIRNNFIANNTATSDEVGGVGGGIYCTHSNPLIENNTIANNRAKCPSRWDCIWAHGGGICCFYSNPIVQSNVISNNLADSVGGGVYCYLSGPKICYNTIALNKNWAIYVEHYSSPQIDSNLIVDNEYAFRNGIEDTLSANWNNIYYNTYQPSDTEIVNLNTMHFVNLENNYFGTASLFEIASIMYGPADFTPYQFSPIFDAPGEPLSISQVNAFSDTGYSIPLDTADIFDTIYIEMIGTDWNPSFCEAAIALLSSSQDTQGIAVALIETDTATGIYRGFAVIDTLSEDGLNHILADTGGCITITANVDHAKTDVVRLGVQEFMYPTGGFAFDILSANLTMGRLHLQYDLPRPGQVKIAVYDVAGRFCSVLLDKMMNAGNHKMSFGIDLPAGVYFIEAMFDKTRLVHKFILIK